ncbi:IpaC/SipC family type III secretion system effector [Chromobacterium vaccinii]|uniref:Effector protein BipC n=1 Tax=Chromobacterium vaccinii TaxID=1108595 RepID=A0A1D9LNB7_9NEIS|nr:IpaC/SipC family type III secretion system effector [Chromobacterium vaccinii]AOZ52603.1 hypothetical protein BKX93_23060 [Chromobacterium vaccinii]
MTVHNNTVFNPNLNQVVAPTGAPVGRGGGVETVPMPLPSDIDNKEKNDGGKPHLTQPKTVVTEEGTRKLKNFIQLKSEEQPVKDDDKKPDGSGLDISHMSTKFADTQTELMHALVKVRTADSKLNGQMSIVSFDAAKAGAAATVKAGQDELLGSVAQSTLQVGMSATGAGMRHGGLSAERGVLKTNSVKVAKLDSEINTNKIKLESPNVKSSDRQELMEHNGKLEIKRQEEHRAGEDTRLAADKKKTSGQLVMDTSAAVGNVAGSAGRYAASTEQANQQISQASSQVASNASGEARDRSRSTDGIIQDVLKVLDGVSQSNMAAMGTVAGNIRA